MSMENDAERRHVLAMVEQAQREGRSEREIVALVEGHLGEAVLPAGRAVGGRRLVDRLLGRGVRSAV